MSLYLYINEFFLFGAMSLFLAEGGSACGCGRVCVKRKNDRFDNQTFTWAQKHPDKDSAHWKPETQVKRCVETGLLVTRSFRIRNMVFSEAVTLAVKERNATLVLVASKNTYSGSEHVLKDRQS